MREIALNCGGVHAGDLCDYSDCSDSCIDSGMDPNEDSDHVTYAAMTESFASGTPVH